MSFDEAELPILNISLSLLDITKTWIACYTVFEEYDKIAKLFAVVGPLSHSILKFLKQEPEKTPEESLDMNAEKSIIFKNLADKFENIIRTTNNEDAIKIIELIKERKKEE